MGKKRIGNFRSNIFGGFNRRDVIGYIEQLHKKLDDLQGENELLRSKLPPEEPEDKDGIEPQNNHLEPESEEDQLKREPDDSGFSLEPEPDEGPGEPLEPISPDKADFPQNEGIASDKTKHVIKTVPFNRISPVPKTEQKTGKHIDISVSNYNESSGKSVSVTKKTIKVRKRTKR